MEVVLVKNKYGVEVDFDDAVMMMDNELREELNARVEPCTEQEFFDQYATKHKERFDEEWQPNDIRD